MAESMDPRKQFLVVNIIDFLLDELNKGSLSEEHKESVEVAIQCLETAFELESLKDEFVDRKINLLSLMPTEIKITVSEEDKINAEAFKNEGNANMKKGLYQEAVNQYTKAIQYNPTCAVYYCNRAAAYSRLDKHNEAITDSEEAIRLDPTYGKAYGRLGIAYSNLNKFDDARRAYLTALKFDPNNEMYETNLKLAEERLSTYNSLGNAQSQPDVSMPDISQFINNPNLINMATQMLSDPSFRNVMSGLVSMGSQDDEGMQALLQAGQTLASRMNTIDPNFVENFRRQVVPNNAGWRPQENADKPADKTEKDPSKKED